MANIKVTITKDTNNPQICVINPDPFKASRGDEVMFVFNEETASITFVNDSPFKKNERVGLNKNMKIRDDAEEKRYSYTIVWPGGGKGAGSGDVGHGR
jgi:hypothetical protein